MRRRIVDSVVAAMRGRHHHPVGVSTGAWIEPDVERRVRLISEWKEPDYASVNLSEDGAFEVMQALIQAGIGIEAGVWSVADAEVLVNSGLADLDATSAGRAGGRGSQRRRNGGHRHTSGA